KNMQKKLFWGGFAWVLIVATLVVGLNREEGKLKRDTAVETDRAVGNAISQYKKSTSEGVNMASGPCLSNDLMPGWVVDVIHAPREEIDDFAENQCAAYREGRAQHIVELDQSGNVVRVK
ncbi:MAG: hypothetical protein Q7S88_03080, partial [Candidatus Daviesbacteria bacterium]|nr:hypothetical protein [Candidatus Daviesbacteria bacterium]